MLGSLQRTVNRFSRRLLRFNTSASAKRLSSPLPSTPSSMASTGSSYLQHKLSTVGGTEEVYAKLQARVESPKFLEDMKASLHGPDDDDDDDDEDFAIQFDVNDPAWWGEATGAAATASSAPAPTAAPITSSPSSQEDDPGAAGLASSPLGVGGDDEGYVIVEKEDVIDALAAFIAGFVAAHPRASSMPPEKLQLALGAAFGELRRGGDKGQVRRLWDWGVSVYRGVSWTYGAVSAFTNPWIARLLLAAVYTSARITCGVGGIIV